jgi:hypothetical protein|tara:strand:+ start:1269 stop:1391 length:123 start_codon:yes stop_codon:yes gene_type:complete
MNEGFNKKYGNDNSELKIFKKYWKIILVGAIVVYFLLDYL